MLNGETAETGPCRAAGAEVVDVVTLGPAEPETAPAGCGDELEAGSSAKELAGRVEPVEEAEAQEDEATDGEELQAPPKKMQVFSETTGLRDDWLHRGLALADMELYQYSIVIERVRIPRVARSSGHPLLFPFDNHYRLAGSYCQQIASSQRNVPRLVGAACPRREASGSEDYACWMATLFTPLRCPGPGGCADPLQCGATLLRKTPDEQHPGYSFALAWRLRRAEIATLAHRGLTKSDAAKRIPVPMDTTLCKRWSSSTITLAHSALQSATIHQVFHQWGRSAVCLQRPIDVVHELWGVPSGHHPHQLHLAEFCACKSADVIMNIDLGVESRNTAKQTAEKRARLHLQADDDGGDGEPAVQPRAFLEFEDVGGQVVDDDGQAADEEEQEADRSRFLVMDKVQDIKWIQRLLVREKEIARARQPGRSPDEYKAMRQVGAVYGDMLTELLAPFPVQARECLGFHSFAAQTLEAQTRRAEAIRRQCDGLPKDGEEDQHVEDIEVGTSVPSVKLFDVEDVLAGPRQVAWKLIRAAELNQDQMRAVALIVKPMQDAWDETADLATRGAATVQSNEPRKLPLVGTLARLLLVGGGGCGKTRIFNKVLAPLLQTFYGPEGVMKEASSNKAARLLQGKTVHTANKLQGNCSLRTVHLRLNEKRGRVLGAIYGKTGAKIIDEFSQLSAKLFHADAFITSIARAPIFNLRPERYAMPEHTWGAMPVFVMGGDELQLPPVPMESSLLAPLEGTSDEQKAGVAIFAGLKHVYRLTTAMRFDDPVLVAILDKMRTPGGAKLTNAEWAGVQATEANDASDLAGTEDWFEACYTWNVVTMATPMRCTLSAREAKAVLFIVQAEDQVANPWPALNEERVRQSVGEQLLRHPNMNMTGRLPGFAMFHIGMRGRLTQSVEPPEGVVDAPGEVVGLDFHPLEPRSHRRGVFPEASQSGAAEHAAAPIVVLNHQPLCVYFKLDDCETEFLPPRPCPLHSLSGADRDCSDGAFYPGILAIKPYKNMRSWTIEITSPGESGARQAKVYRTQLPLINVKSSTLHVLQGTTADPGLIFHWVFPRVLRRSVRWLVIYVALSRVRCLKNLRSIGLNNDIRAIMEEGPPDTLPAQFQKLFRDKEAQTTLDADAAMLALGWS